MDFKQALKKLREATVEPNDDEVIDAYLAKKGKTRQKGRTYVIVNKEVKDLSDNEAAALKKAAEKKASVLK